MTHFSKAFKKLRSEHNLTQSELAEALNLKKSTISMYENGNRQPNFETLELIADYFNVYMSTLLNKDISIPSETYLAKDKPNLYEANEIEIYTMAANGIGHNEKLSDEELQRVKMAIRIALDKQK